MEERRNEGSSHFCPYCRRIPPEAIEIMKRPDGSPWQLGSGGFGTVFKVGLRLL